MNATHRPDGIDDLPEARTIRSSRAFAVPRENLWAFFENPEKLGAWWGPSGFTSDIEEFDFRAGGAWRLVMRGPDGTAYPMRKVFVDVKAPERIVLDHVDPVHGFRMFILLREGEDGTILDWIMVFDGAEEAAKVRPFVETANEQNFERLAALSAPARAR